MSFGTLLLLVAVGLFVVAGILTAGWLDGGNPPALVAFGLACFAAAHFGFFERPIR